MVKPFKVYNELADAILNKDRFKIGELVDTVVLQEILSITNNLKKPENFGLINDCSEGLKFTFISDTSFLLSVGKPDPILAFSGGSFIFIKRKENNQYKLSEILTAE